MTDDRGEIADAYNDGYRDGCRKVEYLEGQIKALSATNEMLVKNMAAILAFKPPPPFIIPDGLANTKPGEINYAG